MDDVVDGIREEKDVMWLKQMVFALGKAGIEQNTRLLITTLAARRLAEYMIRHVYGKVQRAARTKASDPSAESTPHTSECPYPRSRERLRRLK